MAIWDRFKITKSAPILPSGASVTQFTPEQLSGIQAQQYGVGTFNPMLRQSFIGGIPFGPSLPLNPSAINPVRDDGHADPRRFEYPVAWNVFVTEQRLVPWKILRASADQIDILRRCIEVIKNRVAGMDWDFTFSPSASETISTESGKDHVRAMQSARDQFQEDITRMRDFFQVPDRINGLSFKDWVGMLLEEVLVLDALSIYPHPDLKGDLHSFEILDGSTIKPLLDDRGMRPRAPFPAYQQVLYGFPRGEFTATSDDPGQDGSFSADELIYLPRNRRTHTPYGYSPTERALPLADIYLRRQQWLRAEFTDGIMPATWFLSDPTFGGTPELLRAWENILNDDLAGQTEQRQRARILPNGLTPVANSGHAEKFSDAFDEYFIKGICGHFGVMPSEIGFAPASGLGGAGNQDGEAASGNSIGIEPLVKWLETQISDLAYKFLGCPRELIFKFDGGRSADTNLAAERLDREIKNGTKTLNEARAEMNLPLLDSAEADTPMLYTTSGLYFFTADGVVNPNELPTPEFIAPVSSSTPDNPADELALQVTADESATDQVRQEIKAFTKWAKKGSTDREFKFDSVDSVNSAVLNRAAKAQDFNLIKSVADSLLKKA